jgi:hypothetical protein
VRIKGKKEEEENASLKGSSYTIKRKTKRDRRTQAMRIQVGKATTQL